MPHISVDQKPLARGPHLVRADVGQTPGRVLRALGQKAVATGRATADHDVIDTVGMPAVFGILCAEDRDAPRADGRGHVHRPRVVAEIKDAAPEQLGHLQDGQPAGSVEPRSPRPAGADLLARHPLLLAADDGD